MVDIIRNDNSISALWLSKYFAGGGARTKAYQTIVYSPAGGCQSGVTNFITQLILSASPIAGGLRTLISVDAANGISYWHVSFTFQAILALMTPIQFTCTGANHFCAGSALVLSTVNISVGDSNSTVMPNGAGSVPHTGYPVVACVWDGIVGTDKGWLVFAAGDATALTQAAAIIACGTAAYNLTATGCTDIDTTIIGFA